MSLKRVLENRAASASEPALWIVSRPGVTVWSAINPHSAIIKLLHKGTTVRGIEDGDWLKLADEPGYILIRRRDVEFLRRANEDGGKSSENPSSDTTPSNSQSSSVYVGTVGLQDLPPEAVSTFGNGGESSENPSSDTTHSDSQSSSVHVGTVDLKDLPPEVKDESGDLLSVGSACHASGKCRPCLYFPNCKHGTSCNFCHVDLHGSDSYKYKMKLCKGKRQTYKNLIKRTLSAIEQSPETFDVEAMQLPGSVCYNPRVKDKFMKRVHQQLQCASGTSRSSVSSAQQPGQPQEAPAPGALERKRNLMSL